MAAARRARPTDITILGIMQIIGSLIAVASAALAGVIAGMLVGIPVGVALGSFLLCSLE
jgi:hypothetical protein